MKSKLSNQDLRLKLRDLRRSLSPAIQLANSKAAVENFLMQDWDFRRVGVFLADDGELDTQLLIERLWGAAKQTFLPRVGLNRSLEFVEYNAGSSLIANKFGILEPELSAGVGVVSPQELDLVLVPLVGFDSRGSRLGRGGGFYDKSFADKEGRPFMVGWAHSCQEVGCLDVNQWDVPVDALVTERQVFLF